MVLGRKVLIARKICAWGFGTHGMRFPFRAASVIFANKLATPNCISSSHSLIEFSINDKKSRKIDEGPAGRENQEGYPLCGLG
jgi:hypothetical protein